jgi:hypothetical protein
MTSLLKDYLGGKFPYTGFFLKAKEIDDRPIAIRELHKNKWKKP